MFYINLSKYKISIVITYRFYHSANDVSLVTVTAQLFAKSLVQSVLILRDLLGVTQTLLNSEMLFELNAHVHPSGFTRFFFWFRTVHLLNTVFSLAVIPK